MKKRLLLTGASGFFGSHALAHFLDKTDWEVVCPVTFRHKGNPLRITEDEHYQKHKGRVQIISHDLTGVVPDLGDFDYIAHVASDSHVDRSIEDPVPFVENNISITLQILEYARKHPPKKFVLFSTDEVYGAATPGRDPKEWDPIVPSNPYAASKAGEEAIGISYWRTYGLPVVLTNTANIIGERQDPEKFVPMVMKKVMAGEPVPIHGDPIKQETGSRFYLHARNVADAVLYILKHVPINHYPTDERPSRYNIVGEQELDNLTMAEKVAGFLGKTLDYKIVDVHSARPGHDRRYALDGSKLAGTGWKQPLNLDESLKQVVQWTLKNPKWLR